MRRYIERIVDHVLAKALLAFQGEIFERIDSASTSGVGDEIVERIEAVERRMEVVHKECLNFLRSGAQRDARAKKRLEEAGIEDDENAPMTVPIENGVAEEPVVLDDLAYVSHALQKSGIAPVL